MTELLRKKIARRFRELLDAGVHRKKAFMVVLEEMGAARRSVYRYCDEFGISTK